MRAHEFKINQLLHEQASSVQTDINAIIQGVKKNPKNAGIVVQQLTALNNAVDRIIDVTQNQPLKSNTSKKLTPKKIVSSPVESLDEAQQSAVNTAVQLANELKSKIDNVLLSNLDMVKKRETIFKLINDTKNSAVKQAEEEFISKQIDYGKKFKSTIEKLAGKIDNELQKIAGISPFNEEQPGIPLRDVEGKVTAKQQKNLETVKNKITTGLNGVFSDISVMGFTSDDKVKAAINEFLNDMIAGVVDFGDVLQKKQGNIEEMFKSVSSDQGKSPEYIEVFEKVKDAMWNTVIDIGKGTNMGPGELGLALILKPASKSTKGDLGYGDQTIELKGSRDPNSGARLGLEMGNKSNQVSSYQTEILNKYFPKTKPKYQVKVPTQKGGTKSVSLNLTSTGISILNKFIVQERNFNTEKFLLDSILLTLDGNKEDKEKWKNYIIKSNLLSTCINTDNTINYEKWVKALTLIQYQLYGGQAGRSQFKTIMVFSPRTTTYRVINNTREFAKAIDDGQRGKPYGVILSGGLSFNLDKFAKTPQVGIA
jgi:hypothetical protein